MIDCSTQCISIIHQAVTRHVIRDRPRFMWIVLCPILTWVTPLKWIKCEEFRKHKEDEELEVVLPNAEWSWEAFFDEENPLSRSPSERLHIWQILSVHGRLSHVVKHELRGKLGLLLCWLSWLRFPHMYDTTLEVPVKVIQQKSCWARSCSLWIFLTCCNVFESWNLTHSWHKVYGGGGPPLGALSNP